MGESEEPGYGTELKRQLGPFQMFAVSFAFISVAVGIFATYDDVLQLAGPAGIWMWLVTAVGQTLVALVVAQFAARIVLSGSSYQWASRLANPKVGWGFGWMSFCFLAIAAVAADNALASQAFMPLFNIAPDEGVARLITVGILLVQVILTIYSTKIVAVITSMAVGLEVAIVFGLSAALIGAVIITGDGSVSNLTSQGSASGASDYFHLGGPLLLAMIAGLVTLVGFDSAANLAEEAEDPHRSVPRAIVLSVVAASVLGFLFLVALTIAIPDVKSVTDSGAPVAAIMKEQLGAVMEKVLLVCFLVAFFAAGMVTMATTARLVFAMSRDSRFPAHRLFSKVNPRTRTPIPATILVFLGGVALMVFVPGDSLIKLITASTILPLLIYFCVVVLYLSVRRKLGTREGAFSLGRFELPVAIGALAWLALALSVLVLPAESRTSDVIVGGLLLAGALFFAGMYTFNRKVLETEPGGDSYQGEGL